MAGPSIDSARCSSSSTSATPRRTSAPIATSELVEHWRFATVRDVDRRRARRGAAQPARAARDRPRRPRRLDRLLDRAPARARVGGDGRALPRPPDARRRPRDEDRACRSATTTRARSAPTGSSTRSRPTIASGAPCIVVDFGTAVTYDAGLGRGRVPRRHHLPGHRDLAGGADLARGRAAEDRPRAAALADRQDDRRRDPLGRRLRLRRPGRRHRPAPARRAGRRDRGDRHRRAWPSTSSRSPRRSTITDDLLTLTGLRLLHERNA